MKAGVKRLAAASAGEPTLRIAGYASLFNLSDGGGDVVAKGAFRTALGRRGASGVRMLWQHDPSRPIGIWDRIEEDKLGLYVAGRLLTGLELGREAALLITAGALDGLSIGFRAIKAQKMAGGAVRRLAEIDLWEVSLVTFPLLDAARLKPVPSLSSSANGDA